MRTTIGLVGCGRWGTVHHATLRSLKEQGHLDRLVVCDIDEHALEGVVADRHYRSIEEMLAQEQLAGVAIVTPPETHLALARQVVMADLPVFVEKPLGANSKEEMDFLANLPKNATMMVGYLLRHHSCTSNCCGVTTGLCRHRHERSQPAKHLGAIVAACACTRQG